MCVSRALGVGACIKACRLLVPKHGIIIAIGEPMGPLILLNPQVHEHGFLAMQRGRFLLPWHWIILIIVKEGRDRVGEGLDDSDPIPLTSGPDAGGYSIRTLLTAKR